MALEIEKKKNIAEEVEERVDTGSVKIFKIVTALYFIKVRSFFIVFSSDSFYQHDENKKGVSNDTPF